jgi:hypothetical protein
VRRKKKGRQDDQAPVRLLPSSQVVRSTREAPSTQDPRVHVLGARQGGVTHVTPTHKSRPIHCTDPLLATTQVSKSVAELPSLQEAFARIGLEQTPLEQTPAV